MRRAQLWLRRFRSAFVAVVLVWSQDLAAAPACEPAGLLIKQATALETERLCTAWRQTLAELTPLRIDARPIAVEVMPSVREGGVFAAHFGFFDPVRDAVVMQPLDDYLAGDNGGFGEAPTAELWTSFAAHELTHALVHPHLTTTRGRRVTHEFIAYATQLATLDAATVARIVERYDVGPYGDERGVNDIVYALAPHRFGVRAYLTVATHPTPAAYLRGRLREGFDTSAPW